MTDTVPGRPETFVGCLENLIQWLDKTDPIIHELFPHVAGGRGVQEDLERLAKNLAEVPTLDHLLMTMMKE